MRRLACLLTGTLLFLVGYSQSSVPHTSRSQKPASRTSIQKKSSATSRAYRVQDVADTIKYTTPLNFCEGGNVLLTADGSTGGATFQWKKDGIDILSATNQSYTASASGSYSVVVTKSGSSVTYSAVTVTVYPKPVVSFSVTQNSQCSTEPVNFTNTSIGVGLSYNWDFGDPNSGSNNTSTAVNPSHVFVGTVGTGTQTFTVTLTATSSNGCSNVYTSTITTNQRPGTQLTGPSPTTYNGDYFFRKCSTAPSVTLDFNNASTTKSTNTFYRIVWGDNSTDYSSGTFSTAVSHTYTVGSFVLLFIVTGQNGCIDTTKYNVFVGSNPAVGLGNPGNTLICSGTSLTFPVSGTGNNPPGTIYTVSFNDGTRDTVYTSAPLSVTHLFKIGSCGTSSSGFNNSFSATIKASNPCGVSAASVVPIYVSQKTVPSFTVSPKDTICVSNSLTVTNTSIAGNWIDNESCTAGSSVWKISPATGWTITNGSLGDNYGSSDPSSWTNGSSQVTFAFSVAGTYTIKLFTGNPLCGIDSVVKTICVNPTPTGSFTLSQTTGCGPLTVTTTSTTNTPVCGTNRFSWSVSYASTTGCVPNTIGYTYTNGTSASSSQPSFEFTNPGTYTISLVIYAPASSCSTTIASQQVVVKGKPNVSFAIPVSVCQDESVTPSATATCNMTGPPAPTYLWSATGGTVNSPNALSPGTITFNTPGNQSVSLTVSNECGNTIVTQPITVKPLPNLSVPAAILTCPGNSVGPLSFSTTTPSTTFSWTNSNTAIGLTQSNGTSNPIPSFTATNTTASPATSTIKVTAMSGGCSTQSSFTVTVNPTPTVNQTSNQTVCNGESTTAINFSGMGTTYTWMNSNTTIGLAASGTGNIAAFTGVNTGTAPISATITVTPKTNDGVACSGASKTFTITVNPVPSITATANNPISCASATGTIVISGLSAASTYTVNYSKNGTAATSFTQAAAAGGTVTISGLAAGTYSNITVSLGGCPSNVAGPFTLTDPNPPATPTVNSNAPLCSGGTLSLTSNTVSGATYSWTGPNNFTSSLQNPTLSNASTAASGTYYLTVKVSGCTSTPASVDVVVNQTPATPTATNGGAVCSGNTITLNATSATAGVTWTWTGPNGFTSTLSNPTITNATAANAGTYSVTATLGSCVSAAGTTVVTVKPTPSITAVPTNPTNCSSSTGVITISGLANNTAYAFTYTKNSVQQSGSGTSTSSGSLVIGSLTSGIYDNIVVTLNGCPSNAVGPFTLADPNPPAAPTATANGPVCAGSTINLSASSTTSGVSYTWSGPNNYSSAQQNPSITSATTAAGGTYTVTATLNGCTSAAGSVPVVVNATPVVTSASSNTPVCTGDNLNLTATTTFTGAITWNWTGPNNFSSTQQNPVIPAISTADAGTYTVIATAGTGSCASVAKTVTVVVNPTPHITGGTPVNPSNCNTATGTIELNGLTAGSVYTVTYTRNSAPVTATITANSGGVVIISGLTSGVYDNIKVKLSGCTSNAVGPFTLVDPNPPATPVATSTGPVCSGTTLSLQASTTTAGTITWTWSGPNGFTNSSQSPSITNVSTAASGTYSVTATLNGCTSAVGTVDVVVNPTPTAPGISSNTPVCTGGTLNLGSTTSFTGAVTYAWTGPNSFASSLQNPTISNVTTAEGGAYNLVITSATGNCPSPAATTSVVVNTTPVITGSSSTDPTNCNTMTGSIALQGLTAGGTYAVSYTKNGVAQSSTITAGAGGSVVISNLGSGVYDHINVKIAGCPSNTVGPFTLTDPDPPAAPVATSNGPVCSGGDLRLFAASSSSGTLSYTWSGPNGFTSNQQNPVISNVTIAANGTYSVTATLNGCTSTAGTVSVVVHQTPATPVVGTNSPVCTGDTLFLTAATVFSGPVTWQWTGPNGFASTEQNPFIPNTTTAMSGVYTAVATAVTGGCPSAKGSATVVVNPTPAISTATSQNPTNCNTATGSITLEGLTAGVAYTVTYKKNGVAQSATFTANTSGAVVINSLTAGVYDAIRVTLTGCPSNIVGPFTLVDPNPPAMPLAGSNGPVCSGSNLSLTASTTTAGVISWAWTGPNGFTSSTQNPTIPGATVAASGTYSVTVTQNNCVSPAGTVNVVVNQTPATPVAGSNSPICAGSTLNLTAFTTTLGAMTYSWTGPGGFTSMEQNPVLSNATPAASGTYTVTATAVQGGCSSPPASVSVVVHPELVNNIDLAPKTICYSQPVTVTGTAATGGDGSYTYQWQQSTDNSTWTAIAGQTGVSITITPTGSVYLRRKVISSVCQSSSLSVYITVQPPVSNNTVQQDQAICVNTAAAIIIGSVPTGANGVYKYSWEKSTDGWLTSSVIAGATSKDYDPGVLTVTTQYRRIVTTDLCTGPQSSTSNKVVITVRPDAKALFLPTDTLKCPPFTITPAIVNLQTYPAQNGGYQWYVNGTMKGSGTSFPGYTILNEDDSVTVMLKAISLYGCKDDSLSRKFYTYKLPHPSFTVSDTVGCGPLTVQFRNTTPNTSLFTYSWDFGNGQSSTQAQPANATFKSNPSYGDTTYSVRLKVFSYCDTVTVTKSIRVKSKPKALFAPDATVGCSPMTVRFNNISKGIGNSYTWIFGDGTPEVNTATADTISHIFYTGVPDTFYVKLVATNECGSDTMQYAIRVAPNTIKLDFAVNGNEQSGCAPHTVRFVNNSRGASSFTWDFKDGTVINSRKNIDTLTHTFLLPGTYVVTLRATNGCSDTTSTETIVVYPTPQPAFTANNYTVCIGDSVRFTNNSTNATSYQWQFGDGAVSSQQQPVYAYKAPGTYRVVLKAFRFNAPGSVCSDSTVQQVQVVGSMKGTITTTDTVGYCAPFTVSFSNQNLPSVTANWDFGDGSTGAGNNVSHTFLQAGTYIVKALVTVPGGCTYSTTKSISVLGPKGTLTYTSGYLCNSAAATFQVAVSNTDTLVYDFGDGSRMTTTNNVVYHSYANPGAYLPSVQLKNKAGCVVQVPGVDTIKVDKIRGGFVTREQRTCGSTLVDFTDTSYTYYGRKIVLWNFGDGSTGTGVVASHTYTTGGVYPVQMIVVGNSGCSDTVRRQMTVTVYSQPKVAITGNDVVCANTPVSFTANIQSTDAVTLLQWKLSNGVTSTANPFTYRFTQTGSYVLTLVAGTINGCYDTVRQTITVNPTPVVIASADMTLCQGNKVQLSVTSTSNVQYNWNPLKDLSCSTCPDPVVSPLATTPYVVQGTNSFGCSGYDTVVVTVIQPMKMKVSPSDSICIGQSKNLMASGATSYQWSPSAGLSSTTASNPVATPTITTTYRVVGYDGFNCFTDTAYVIVGVGQYPTVNLGPDLTLATGTAQPMLSSVTNGPIRNWLWTPATDLSCSTCPQPVATIKKDITYTVKVTTFYGCSATDTINIKAFCESAQVFIPNAFTPDGDGVNDVLMVRGTGIMSVKSFRIFNRWGDVVFEKNNFQPNNKAYGWDGRINGIVGGPDVYVYTAEVMCENGSTFTYKGNVSILK